MNDGSPRVINMKSTQGSITVHPTPANPFLLMLTVGFLQQNKLQPQQTFAKLAKYC